MLAITLLVKQEGFITTIKLQRDIYGRATTEETAELLEEGIDVATIPWIRNDTEN